MTDVKWSNLETAAPLCRHTLDDALDLQPSTAFGAAEFAAMIRNAYRVLYAPDARCVHTEGECDGE